MGRFYIRVSSDGVGPPARMSPVLVGAVRSHLASSPRPGRSLGRTRLRRRTMAVTTRNGAFIGGEWVEGDGDEIEVTSPTTGEVIERLRVDANAGRHGGTGRGRGISRLAQDIGRRARRDLPPGLHAVHGAQRGDRADDLAGGRQDDPRVTRGDGGVHGRPLPSRLEDVLRHAGKVLPSTQERSNSKRILIVQQPVGAVAAVSPWNFPVDIAGIPIVYGARGRLYRRLEAVRVRATLREHVRGGHARCRVPSRHDQRRPRPRRRRPVARHPSAGRLRGLHRVGRNGREGCPRRGPEEPRARARRNGPQIVLADADIDKAADAAIVGCFYLQASAARLRSGSSSTSR